MTRSNLKLKASCCIFFAQCLLRKPSPNYVEAVNFWTRALMYSIFTNPIAAYNLAVHYYLGKGVIQDFSKAFGLFEKAGSFDNHLYGCRNFGVKEAHFALGKCFEDGTGQRQNFEKAGEWYYKAQCADYGYGPADIKYANLCRANLIGDGGQDNVAATQRFLDASAKWGFVPHSLSVDFLLDYENPLPRLIFDSSQKHWIKEREIRTKAETLKDGFSASVRNAMNDFAQGLYAMANYFDGNPEKANRDQVDIVQQEIIHQIASSYRWSSENVAVCCEDMWQKFKQIINPNLTHPLDNMSNTSNLDRDTRICKLADMKASMMTSTRPQQALAQYLKFLRQSKSKYPNELYFHRMSLFMASVSEVKFGADAGLDLDATIQMFPNHPDILYLRGVIIGARPVGQVIMQEAYLDFIKIAAVDHKDLPDTFYRMAELEGKFYKDLTY